MSDESKQTINLDVDYDEYSKMEEKIGRDYCLELKAMPKEALDEKLLELAKYREEIKLTRSRDPQLESAKERVKTLSEPYREQLKGNELKSKYITIIMRKKDFL